MPNVATVLRDEIARLSRKEIRSHVDPTRKATAQHRREIRSLKRQVAQLEHVDVPLAHEVDEDLVVALRLGDVQDVVEEQVVAVRGGQVVVGAPRAAHHDSSELANLGVDSVLLIGHGILFLSVAAAHPCAAVRGALVMVVWRVPQRDRVPVARP